MKSNVGTADRLVRFGVAIILVMLYATGSVAGTLAYVLLGVAAILLLTSLIKLCPLYSLLGINTCPMRKSGP